MKNKVNKSLLSKLKIGMTLATLVFSSVTLSGCGRVYFPAGRFNLTSMQKEDAELKRRNRSYNESMPEPIPVLIYAF